MKKLSNPILVLLFILLNVNSNSVFAQKGTLKIFSELKQVDIYLDEKFQGTDIIQIDSLQIGGHYLKAIKDSVNIFSELVTINPNATTTVLIKYSEEVKRKLLEGKFTQQQQYRAQKIDILISKKYITETQGKSSSISFPDYYSISSYGKYNSTSVTSEQIVWKIVVGGTREISEASFASLTNNENILTQINQDNAKRNKKVKRLANAGGITCLTGGVLAGVILGGIIAKRPYMDNMGSNQAAALGTAGIMGSLAGYVMLNASGNINKENKSYYSLEGLVNAAVAYNQKLKLRLGLPENFDM